MNLPWVEKIRRADRDNTIDVYISDDHDDVLAEGTWQQFFTEKPEVLTREEKRAWLDTLKGVSLGSDAFFPFGDNIERAHKSGVEYIAQAGGSVRDDHVIETCDKYGITMAFTGIRLFHHYINFEHRDTEAQSFIFYKNICFVSLCSILLYLKMPVSLSAFCSMFRRTSLYALPCENFHAMFRLTKLPKSRQCRAVVFRT